MGYNRSGTRFKQRKIRRRREARRLEKKVAAAQEAPAAPKGVAAKQ